MPKVIIDRTEDASDCFGMKNSKCVVLTKINCKGCAFYKSNRQYAADKEKAAEKIYKLAPGVQEYIYAKYYSKTYKI